MSKECKVATDEQITDSDQSKDELIEQLQEDNDQKDLYIADLESQINDLEYCISEQDREFGELQDELEEYREFKRALKRFYQGYDN